MEIIPDDYLSDYILELQCDVGEIQELLDALVRKMDAILPMYLREEQE